MPIQRFRVVFEDIRAIRYTYYVCTMFGERKAIVIAASVHQRDVAFERQVYAVPDVAIVDGDSPESPDLIDRNEW
ncbi:MAG TPA: hypothetical protein VGQ76_16730 [Thermoanaerobaculia bacterium]|jgi:hypothetical protein|nr:hypothetical protein [Thermoanaerobaculia bacterium]